jgi:2-polyprenyl-6-methoxyphenol hydroxylase-like FAD-dependent oxidoreductase
MGAGPAGLLAARALAETFERVTVLERDPMPIDFEFRGRPQDRPFDSVQPPAAQAMEELDPGLLADLEEAGVPVLFRLDQMHLEMAGHTMCRSGDLSAPLHRPGYPFLMDRLRARRPSRVEIRYGTTAVDLLVSGGRVVGVAAEAADGPREFAADLVVDAAGRDGHTALWMSRWGLPVPEEDRQDVAVRYASLVVRRFDVPADVEIMFHSDAYPGRPWGLSAGRIERDRWALVVFGYGGNHPPLDRAGLLAFVSGLLPQPWLRVFAQAEPVDPPTGQEFPTSIRRRYELARNFPAGLVPVGDAWCSANPVYGRGMTLAAQAAMTLRDVLRTGDDADLGARYLAAAAPILNRAWQLSCNSDRAYPQISGVAADKQGEQVLHAVLAVAEQDPEVINALLRFNYAMPGGSMTSVTMMAKTSKVGRAAKRDAKHQSRDAKHQAKAAKHQAKQDRRQAVR